MPTTVNISLAGCVAVYDDGANWNLVFITDNDHQLVISDLGGSHPDQTIRTGKDRVLKLAAGQVSDPRRSYTDNAKNYALNMSAPYLHDADSAAGTSNLHRTHSPGHGRELVRVHVPYGTIDCSDYPGPDFAPDYWIEDLLTGETDRIGHPIANVLKLSFVDESGRQLELTSNDPNEPVVNPWVYEADVLNLKFDNDCRGQGRAEDFMHYYDCVFDKRDKRIMFTAGRLGGGVLASQGDCDPTVIDPPPGPPTGG